MAGPDRRRRHESSGVQWGSAADQSNVYVALSDIGRIKIPNTDNTEADPKRGGGIWALRLSDGQQAWMTPPPGCGESLDAAPPSQRRSAPSLAWRSRDRLTATCARTPPATARSCGTSTQRVRIGPSTACPRAADQSMEEVPAIAGGMVFATSGYHNGGGMPGNVLLAFSVDA